MKRSLTALIGTLFLISLLLSVSAGAQGRGGGTSSSVGGSGGGAPTSSPDPTPFEQFVSKLKLDSKKQLPQVEQLFTAAATEAAPIVQEMMRLRTAMIAQHGNADTLAPINEAYVAAATRMTAIEVRAFKSVQALLTPNQLAKSAEAFTLMAGIFQPPTPRAPRAPRGGGGQ